MLGPLEVGEGARIGSNAVGVMAVPPGSTVVGVPGRLIEPASPDTDTRHREKMASKMGFDAYGATEDAPDPVAHAINCMLDHLHVMEGRMKQMCETMSEMGMESPAGIDLPDLPSCENIYTAEEMKRIHFGEQLCARQLGDARRCRKRPTGRSGRCPMAGQAAVLSATGPLRRPQLAPHGLQSDHGTGLYTGARGAVRLLG